MLIHLFVVYMYILRSQGHSAAGDLQFQLVIVMETLLVSHRAKAVVSRSIYGEWNEACGQAAFVMIYAQ